MAVRAGYKRTEVGVLPEDWNVETLTEIGQIIDGDRGANYPGAGEFTDGGYCLFLSADNVTKSGFKFERCQFISGDKDKKLRKGRLVRGDVVLTTRGTVGNFAYYSEGVPFDAVRINSGMVILRNESTRVLTPFLYSTLKSTIIERQIDSIAFGSAQPQLTVKGIAKLQVAYPSSSIEQGAITRTLEDADALIESLEQLLSKKCQIKQGAMQELLTGKKRLPGFSSPWQTMPLGTMGKFLKGNGISRAESASGGLPCIRYGEIYTTHNFYVREFRSLISERVAATATRIERGDLLFAGSGETKEEIGKCVAIVDNTVAYAGGDIVILRTTFGDPLFLGYYLNTPFINRQKASRGQGDAVVHISGTALSQIECNVPREDEQSAIGQCIREMDDAIYAVEAKLAKARQLKQGMMQELLTGRIRLV